MTHTIKLTKKMLDVLHHALTICESDYEVDEKNPEQYRINMLRDIASVRRRLIAAESEGVRNKVSKRAASARKLKKLGFAPSKCPGREPY